MAARIMRLAPRTLTRAEPTTRNNSMIIHTIARIAVAALLTRAVAKRITAGLARKVVEVEKEAKAAFDAVEDVDQDPDEVLKDHTVEGADELEEAIRELGGAQKAALRKLRATRFVAALVQLARAEYGSPFGPEYHNPDVIKATRIKVGTFLRRYCKEKHVRTRDIAFAVDEAVELYFVPTRRDVRIQLLKGSAEAAMRREELRRAQLPLCGKITRGLLRLVGHDVGPTAPKIGGKVESHVH